MMIASPWALADHRHVIGVNFDIDIGTVPEDIWSGGGVYTFPASAAATTIVSDSADDTASGTGVQTVYVEGLDSEYKTITEIATLDGVTPVTLTHEYLRINFAQGAGVGSGGTNAGNISIKHGASTIGHIAAGHGRTLAAIYTVPANYVAMRVTKWWLIGSYATVMQIQARCYCGCWCTITYSPVDSVGWQSHLEIPFRLAARTDIRGRVISTLDQNSIVSAGFHGWLLTGENE